MRPSLVRWFLPVPGSFLLQFVFGSFYAIGIFASRMPDPSLTYALGAGAWALAVSLTYAGIAINSETQSGLCQARRLAKLGGGLLFAQVLLPVGLSYFKPLVWCAAIAMGAGYGMIYIVSLTVLQAWVPDKPGTATGAILFAGGVGTLFFVAVDAEFVETLGSINYAIGVVGIIQCVVALLAGLIVFLPPSSHWHPEIDARRAMTNGEVTTLLKDEEVGILENSKATRQQASVSGPKMAVRDILLEPTFYVLFAAILAGVGPGFGIILHGSRMQTVLFGTPPITADHRFFFVTLFGVIARLLTGLAVDGLARVRRKRESLGDASAAIRAGSNHSFESAKTVLAYLLTWQAAMLAFAFPITRAGLDWAFPPVMIAVYVAFSGASVLAVCMFGFALGPQNTSLAFSLIGLPLGFTDFAMSVIVGMCAELSKTTGRTQVSEYMYDYDLYFLTSLVTSLFGLLMVFILRPAKAVREATLNPTAKLLVANAKYDIERDRISYSPVVCSAACSFHGKCRR
jgi:hypothetical protein